LVSPAPSVLLEFGRSLQTSNALSIVAAVRVVFDVILLRVAPASRTPKVFRVLGVFIIIAGVVTSLFGVERAHAAFDWWSPTVFTSRGHGSLWLLSLVYSLVKPSHLLVGPSTDAIRTNGA
jgi:hypothetical protein